MFCSVLLVRIGERGLAVVSPSEPFWFEFIIYSVFSDCHNQYLPTLFKTHFLNTSSCLVLSASFLWVEKPGFVDMSGNYAWREVPTKRLKQNAHCVCAPCTSHPLSPSSLLCLFLVRSLYLPSALCVLYCCSCASAQSGTWPQVRLCYFVLLQDCGSVFTPHTPYT